MRETRYVRICSSVPATRYQTPAFSTRPIGSSSRSTVSSPRRYRDRRAARLPHRVGERGEVRDRVARAEPRGRVEVEALDQARGAGTELAGQRGEDLQAGSGDDRAQPELRGRAGHAGEEERLRLVRGEPGQPRPVAVDELDAAVRAALGVDRHARGAERVDVAMDRALADLELGRQHRGRGPAARLEEQEQLDEA